MNILQELISLTQPKINYKVGMIIYHTGTFCVIKDAAGGEHKVSGMGYKKGENVLVENNIIIGKVSQKIKKVFIS